MKTKDKKNGFESVFLVFILTLISAVIYLPFIRQFGYYKDDWYLMYAAGAKGISVFSGIFIVDRPMRTLVMSFAYSLFGNNPVLYNLSAWGARVISAILFFHLLCLLWPRQKKIAWISALLYLIYPGFLSQFNGIDYQSQMVSLAVGMFSLLLLVYAYRSPNLLMRVVLFIFLILTTTFYLGLVEYFIGIEIFKLACVLMLVFRDKSSRVEMLKKSFFWLSYSLQALLPFLVWRLFFFHGERGATDVNVKLSDILADPIASLIGWSAALMKNILDVSLWAWTSPLRRLGSQVAAQEWFFGAVISVLVLVLAWFVFRSKETPKDGEADTAWRIEAIWLGVVMLVFGLLPVILVGRFVDFKSFSRYALAPSIGVVLLWQAILAFIPNVRFKNIFYALLLISSTLTHYGNALAHVHETEATRDFWWQISWRIPQLEPGTTLVTHYSVAAEEDYFTWGPANLIYYPESFNERYVQPAIPAVLLDEETISKTLARTRQEYSNRRSIVTYPNYRNILVLTQPTPAACLQVLDSKILELSSAEDARAAELAPYSEADHILLGEPFHTPPAIPFGAEPPHGWCFYYQKASYARQAGDWDEVLRLGEEAHTLGFSANDPLEWMPFLQAYAYSDNSGRMNEIASFMTPDLLVTQQACHTLTGMPLSPSTLELANKLFCVGK